MKIIKKNNWKKSKWPWRQAVTIVLFCSQQVLA